MRPEKYKNKILAAYELPICLIRDPDIKTSFDFAIATVAQKSQKYFDIHRKENRGNRYLVLDNGAFEEPEPIDNNTLLDIAEELKADEIVVPDFIGSAQKTMFAMGDFLGKFRKRDSLQNCKIQGVIEGANLNAVMECYRYFLDLDEVDVIGLPYWRLPESCEAENGCFGNIAGLGGRRLYLTHHLISQKIFHKKPFHLLGLCYSRALDWYRNYPMIRSIDTSLPVITGLKGQLLARRIPKPKEKLEFLKEDVTSRQRKAIVMNCYWMNRLLQRPK